jgi:hypothetical protein
VNWNGIGAERVEHENIESSRVSFRESEPSVPEHDAERWRTVPQKCEETTIEGNSRYDRIDFIERPILTGVPITRKTSGAESDYTDIAMCEQRGRDGMEYVPSRPIRMVVGEWDESARGNERLRSVQRRSVMERHEIRSTFSSDAIHSKKTSFGIENVRAVRVYRRAHVTGDEERSQSQAKSEWPAAKTEDRDTEQDRKNQRKWIRQGRDVSRDQNENDSEENGKQKIEQSRPSILLIRGQQSACERESYRIFVNAIEGDRGDQSVEHSTNETTKRDPQKEFSEVRCGRSHSSELAVTNHCDNKEHYQVRSYPDDSRKSQAPEERNGNEYQDMWLGANHP